MCWQIAGEAREIVRKANLLSSKNRSSKTPLTCSCIIVNVGSWRENINCQRSSISWLAAIADTTPEVHQNHCQGGCWDCRVLLDMALMLALIKCSVGLHTCKRQLLMSSMVVNETLSLRLSCSQVHQGRCRPSHRVSLGRLYFHKLARTFFHTQPPWRADACCIIFHTVPMTLCSAFLSNQPWWATCSLQWVK